MTFENRLRTFRRRRIAEATRRGHVKATCERCGLSRTPFDRLQWRLESDGVDGLHLKRQRARRGRPVEVP